AFISIAMPVVRYAVAGSWGTAEGARYLIVQALNKAYLSPLFDSFTPMVLSLIRPLLPSGLPDVLRGRLADVGPTLSLLLHL
ncbi:MAG: hypothetical protein ACOYEW_05265, partial [Anaerolineae bacterium]